MSAVFDASALLAILNDEPGAHHARSFLRGGIISTVNVVEVGTKLVDKGASPEVARAGLRFLKLKVVDFDASLAELAVEFRSLTRPRGLSLADRACLALATRERLPALTADRIWATLELPCSVELIR